MAAVEPNDQAVPEHVVHDDLLRLLFTCCHPALSLETQVALALRTLCGLTVAETGRALLVPEATMAKRLTRARQKIAVARIPYRVPDAAELPDRIRGVTATVYLLFNESYSPADGDAPERPALAKQALRLARLLRELLPDEASIAGLLALVLLTEARRPARIDDNGFVLLPEQDRSLWDAALIREGVLLVGLALQRTPDEPDPYVTQAAIAACHCLAASAAETDWTAITSWYDVLVRIADTPVVRLNRAVALAERDGPSAGLAEIDAIDGLASYALWHAARAELLVRDGRADEAAVAYRAALGLPGNAAQREQLQSRLTECLTRSGVGRG